MIASLAAAREAFRVAEGSEEIRPDATLFRLMLDAALEFDELERDREGALQRIGRLAAELRRVGARTKAALEAAVAQALTLISPAEARAFFAHCGFRLRPDVSQWFCS